MLRKMSKMKVDVGILLLLTEILTVLSHRRFRLEDQHREGLH
jgi:hypothetical protein